MRSHGLIIAPDIINNGAFSLSDILITTLWHPLCFKASEEALSWGAIPTVTFSAHTLRHTLTACHGFSKLPASIRGNADAQVTLGVMYYAGEDVPQDYKKALKWFQKAANQGDDNAQYHLGLMYAMNRPGYIGECFT